MSAQATPTTPKEVKSTPKAVTIFFNNAQVTRRAQVSLPAGETTLRFSRLSRFLTHSSVQIQCPSGITVHSVTPQPNRLTELEPSPEEAALLQQLDAVNDKLITENTNLRIAQENITFMQENRVVAGKNQALSVATLKESAVYYNAQMRDLLTQEQGIHKRIAELQQQKAKLEEQIKPLKGLRRSSTDVLVRVSTTTATTATFELSYMVSAASWSPCYDIRMNGLNQPMQIVYKANIQQNSGEDWERVALRLSSSDPQQNGNAPELHPRRLRFYEPMVRNTRLYAAKATAAPMAMESRAMADTDAVEEDAVALGAAVHPSFKVSDGAAGQTAVEFTVSQPYSIMSGGDRLTIDMLDIKIPATFEYIAIPKLNPSAFLMARITEWEQHNLLNGEANVFFENTFVGATYIDLGQSDTLKVSLGVDRNIGVSREKTRDYTDKQALGSKREVQRGWRITVKNNKQQRISISVYDQIPLSTH
ncbi:MAG: mucoidy inhibitor MuiA family protein, partial [Bacteroidales bacterium]|nr:mucoidy inhibitor MuiA family protein [Bacteroidales bacterium]